MSFVVTGEIANLGCVQVVLFVSHCLGTYRGYCVLGEGVLGGLC